MRGKLKTHTYTNDTADRIIKRHQNHPDYVLYVQQTRGKISMTQSKLLGKKSITPR